MGFAIPALSLADILWRLDAYFQEQPASVEVRLVGLVFCRPQSRLAREEVIPHIPYFHARSAERAILFFSGFADHKTEHGQLILEETDDRPAWWYDDYGFNALRREIEEATSWRYSGGTDLILTNAVFDREAGRSSLAFESAIAANLDEMKRDEVFVEAPMFFERVFQFADRCDGSDPTWGFSDRSGVKIAQSALGALVLSALPEPVRKKARGASHLAVSNLSRRG